MKEIKKGQIYKYYNSDNELLILELAYSATDLLYNNAYDIEYVVFKDLKTNKVAIENIDNFMGWFNLKGKDIERFVLQPSKVFSKEECIFHYCPQPELCKELGCQNKQ